MRRLILILFLVGCGGHIEPTYCTRCFENNYGDVVCVEDSGNECIEPIEYHDPLDNYNFNLG